MESKVKRLPEGVRYLKKKKKSKKKKKKKEIKLIFIGRSKY